MRARRRGRTQNPATSQGARHRLIGQGRSPERQRTCVPEEDCRTDGSGRTSSRNVMVPEAGIEPARPCGRGILSPLRLPVPPLRQRVGSIPRTRNPPPQERFPIPSGFEFRDPKPLTAGRPAVGSASRWGRSSVGRVLEWHSRGRGFDSRRLHHFPLGCLRLLFDRSHTDRRVKAADVHPSPMCLSLALWSLPH